jgi:hypothetical protein
MALIILLLLLASGGAVYYQYRTTGTYGKLASAMTVILLIYLLVGRYHTLHF